MAEEKFQSIYGDAESEFDVEDVSDETLSISKEEIEEKIQEEASAEEPAPVEQASAEETAEAEEPATESAPTVEETAAEPEAESKDSDPAPAAAPEEPAADAGELDETDGITFEDHAVHYHGEDDESGYEPIAEHHHDHDDRANDHHAHEEDHDDHDDDHVSVISYILHAILFTIPVIGTILMLIYIISDNKNEHLRHFAQIWLITLLIIAIGAYAALTILGIA